ncbi:MAG: DUF3078 domain-containing protein [Bacteroidetes bacterium]|nr:DUF3078 domain-containing protein [Bacteroidota bacterium]
MRKGLLSIFFLCMGHWILAQDISVTKLRTETSRTIRKELDTTHWNWKQGGLYNFNLSQSSLSNWAAGGDNFNMSLNTYFNYYFFFKKAHQNLDNNIDVNLGFIQSTSLGGRKNDDRLDFLSKYGYQIDTSGMWFISGLFNLRSQFFDGFSFSGTNSTLTSSFLAPAYIILSAGLDFKPTPHFSIFFSPLTSRTTLLLNNTLSNLGKYGVPVGDKISKEVGTFITVNYNNTIATNINYKGRADFFSNYNQKPENINLYMTNMFSFKINKYFSASYNLDLIYDDKIKIFGPLKTSPGLQVKSVIGIGFQKTLQVKKKIVERKNLKG